MKPGGAEDLRNLLAMMDPVLSERAWCFQPISDLTFIPETAFAVVREEEGIACILPATASSPDAVQLARITLSVHSDLEAVGLTAAVSNTLATSGIACNVIAGLHHDHLLVPWEQRDKALRLLERLSRDAHR